MGTNRNVFKWLFQNIAPGEQDPEKRVDADRIMDNYEDLRDLVAAVEARGGNAVDGNSQGLSTVTQCNLTIKTANGMTGLVNLGDYVQVADGANQWRFRNAVAADEISFSSADLVQGNGPAEYSEPAFIASLVIHAAPFRSKVGKGDIILVGSHVEKLTGADIEADVVDPTPLGEKVGELKRRVDVTLDESGYLHADVIENAALAPAAMLLESFENIIWGGFDADFDNDGLANRWLKFNTPLCELEGAIRRIGNRSQKVTASQPLDGIYAHPNTYNYRDYLADYVSFSVWVYATDASSVVLEIYDGVRTSTSPPGGVAGAWVRVGLDHYVDGDAIELQFRVYANRATVFYADGAMAKRGRLQPGYAAHPVELMRSFMSGEDYANWVINSYFRAWTNGGAALPDFWRTGGGFNAPAAVTRDTSWFLFGDASLRATLTLGQGLWQELPAVADFRGQTVYANAYIRGVEGAAAIRLGLRDDHQDYYTETSMDEGEVLRLGVKLVVSDDASFVRLYLSNQDTGEATFNCDGVMLTRGEFPIAFKPAAAYVPLSWDFALPGPVTAGRLWHGATNADVFAVPDDCIVHRISVYEGSAPGGGSDVFTVTRNGAGTALSAAVAAGQNAAAKHDPQSFTAGDRIQVVATPSVAPGADAGVSVEGYRLVY